MLYWECYDFAICKINQADKVRQLKASNASKDTVEAEVKTLKELKALQLGAEGKK